MAWASSLGYSILTERRSSFGSQRNDRPQIRTLPAHFGIGIVMRPLYHPSLDDISVEGILHALSDPVRAHILARILRAEGAQTCSAFLQISERPIPKSTLSQHFKALREAGLIRSERKGVELHNTTRCLELEKRFPGLIAAIVNAHKVQSWGKSQNGHARKPKAAKRKTKSK